MARTRDAKRLQSIVQLSKEGLSYEEIGKRFGIQRNAIGNLLRSVGVVRSRGRQPDVKKNEQILTLHKQGVANGEIATLVGLDRSQVSRNLMAMGVFQRRGPRAGSKASPSVRRSISNAVTLSPRAQAVLLGTLMGDGCLKKPHRPDGNVQFKLGHCLKQKDYMLWKFEELRCLFTEEAQPYLHTAKLKYKDEIRKYATCEITSRALPVLAEYRRWLYPNGKKTITQVVIDALNACSDRALLMALWYMDDGSIQAGVYARLVLGGYSATEYQLLVDWFRQQGWGGSADKAKKSNCVTYCLDSVSSREFFDLISPHVHSSMRYKLPSRVVRTRRTKHSSSRADCEV